MTNLYSKEDINVFWQYSTSKLFHCNWNKKYYTFLDYSFRDFLCNIMTCSFLANDYPTAHQVSQSATNTSQQRKNLRRGAKSFSCFRFFPCYSKSFSNFSSFFIHSTTIWHSNIFCNGHQPRTQHARIHANVFKNWPCPNFSYCPKNISCPCLGGGGGRGLQFEAPFSQ